MVSAIIVKIEVAGDAREFMDRLLEDHYYAIKSNADLLAQYETLTYKVEEVKL